MATPREPYVKKLYRSRTERRWLGVCGGLAMYFEVDPTFIRLTWIVLSVASGIVPGLVAYLVAAIIIPNEPH